MVSAAAQHPAAFVAGTLCDERVFDPLAARLPLDCSFAAPIAQADVASAAAEVLASAPVKFIAVGFSLGGFVVLELLRSAPGRLSGAVLIATNLGPLGEGMAEARREQLELARRRGPRAVVDILWPRYVAPQHLARDDWRDLVVAMAEAVGADRFAPQVEIAIGRPDSRATLSAASVPVLVLCGEQDRMCPPERCVPRAAGPHVRVETIADAGHFLPLEAPGECARAIASWLEETVPCS